MNAPKPPPSAALPRPKPKRLRERPTVTIIAGFKCSEGIVLCSDTQETIAGISKRNVPKLQFEPAGGPHEGAGLAAVFCGAGDNGTFIDKIVEIAWEDAQEAPSLDDACAEIEESIKRTYQEFGQIYQPGYCPTADLIYGVKMQNTCRLFGAQGPIVKEKKGYDAKGAGEFMADFLAKRMYAHNLTLRQCVILAAYIIFQAKEHVDGCGGESHIAVLRDQGVSGKVNLQYVDSMTQLAEWIDQDFGTLLLKATDTDLTSEEFTEAGQQMIQIMDVLRKGTKAELERESGAFLKRTLESKLDFLGLPLPSDG